MKSNPFLKSTKMTTQRSDFLKDTFQKDLVLYRWHYKKTSLKEMQEETGITVPEIKKAYNDGGMTIDTFIKLCDWMGVDPKKYLTTSYTKQPRGGIQSNG